MAAHSLQQSFPLNLANHTEKAAARVTQLRKLDTTSNAHKLVELIEKSPELEQIIKDELDEFAKVITHHYKLRLRVISSMTFMGGLLLAIIIFATFLAK